MESRVTVYIGGVVDNLPPPSGVEEMEQKEIKDRLKLRLST